MKNISNLFRSSAKATSSATAAVQKSSLRKQSPHHKQQETVKKFYASDQGDPAIFEFPIQTPQGRWSAEEDAYRGLLSNGGFIPAEEPDLLKADKQSAYSSLLDQCLATPVSLGNHLNEASPQQENLKQNLSATQAAGDPLKQVSYDISSIMIGNTNLNLDYSFDSKVANDDQTVEDDTELPWITNKFNSSAPLRRKELARDRKNKWIFKNTQKTLFVRLVNLCLEILGSGSAYQVLYKLGRGTSLKEFNTFIKGCIESARNSTDEKGQYEQILEAYRLLQLMKERGFPIEEDAFGPFLLYLIDMHMEEHFINLLDIVKEEDTSLHPRLGYYEMLFWIEMNNEEKIQELCEQITTGEVEMGTLLHENYLLALCERDRKKELLQVLDVIDITRVSSLDNVATIFKSLGRLSLEDFAELFLLVLRDCDHEAQSISDLIFFYTSSFKDTTVKDVILKFKEMHDKLDLTLLAGSYEKLISLCIDSVKVPMALDLVDEMCEAGLSLTTQALNIICHACEESCDYMLVHRIYRMINNHKLEPNSETIEKIINLYVKMKDFDCAYDVLEDLEMMNLSPSASMYNAILAGYYREKNMDGVLRVLQQMKDAGVKPDSQTFGYLISNSKCEEDILKYYEQMKDVRVEDTKHVFMKLINAYAASCEFVKAKEVVQEEGLPVKNINESKSALVSSLASHGKISDAVDIYKEIKKSGCSLEPKAVISLIEHLQDIGDLRLLLRLLEELSDPHYWVDGCCRILLYCVRNKDLRTSVGLLKRLSENSQDDDSACEVIFDQVFSHIADMKSPDLQFGLDLLKSIKEDLKLHPSRKCLDFLLSACVNSKDLQKAQLVWKEYQINGLPYNILSYSRMYQAYLVSGDMEAANSFLSEIPKDDPHMRSVLHACRVTYGASKDEKKTEEKEEENLEEE